MPYEKLKCCTPLFMKLDICNSCGLKAEKIENGKEYDEHQPKKTRFNGWKCDSYEHKNQGNLFE